MSEEQEVPDPDNQGETMTVEVQVMRQKAKDSMMLKMEIDVYMLHYKNWIEESRHWKTNWSRLHTLHQRTGS